MPHSVAFPDVLRHFCSFFTHFQEMSHNFIHVPESGYCTGKVRTSPVPSEFMRVVSWGVHFVQCVHLAVGTQDCFTIQPRLTSLECWCKVLAELFTQTLAPGCGWVVCVYMVLAWLQTVQTTVQYYSYKGSDQESWQKCVSQKLLATTLTGQSWQLEEVH